MPHKKPEVNQLADRLRQHSRKLTGPRRAILELLRAQAHPMTNKEIWERLTDCSCDLATIYRSIHLLETMGLVKRFDFGDGSARYELVSDGEDDHHHHLICVRCSEVVEIEDCFPPELEEKIAAGNGFKSITHKLEFFGVCPQCQ
jgi:Fur family transcriptional regulator, ferric uptake regulator